MTTKLPLVTVLALLPGAMVPQFVGAEVVPTQVARISPLPIVGTVAEIATASTKWGTVGAAGVGTGVAPPLPPPPDGAATKINRTARLESRPRATSDCRIKRMI